MAKYRTFSGIVSNSLRNVVSAVYLLFVLDCVLLFVAACCGVKCITIVHIDCYPNLRFIDMGEFVREVLWLIRFVMFVPLRDIVTR